MGGFIDVTLCPLCAVVLVRHEMSLRCAPRGRATRIDARDAIRLLMTHQVHSSSSAMNINHDSSLCSALGICISRHSAPPVRDASRAGSSLDLAERFLEQLADLGVVSDIVPDMRA